MMEAGLDPKYVSGEPPDKVSEHEANCWHSVWRSRQFGFDLEDTFTEREELCRIERLQRGMQSVRDRGRVSTAQLRENFDASVWKIIPRCYSTLFGFLSKVNHHNAPSFGLSLTGLPEGWAGIKILEKTDPKYCPVCETGVCNKLRLETLQAQYTTMGDTFERLELQQKIVKLDAKVKKYIKHLEALEKNREFIKELLR